MPNYDYVRAKLHAIHSKSITIEKYNKLKQIDSIDKLCKELLPDDYNPEIQLKKLYTYTEKKYKEKIFNDIINVSKYLNHKNKFIKGLMLGFEIDNIKLIIKSYYNNKKSVDKLFEVNIENSLNYKQIYNTDLSVKKNIIEIFKKTIFSFIIFYIEQKKDIFIIENELDKFYYKNLINSLKESSNNEETKKILDILFIEMNWQNILWAFRTKVYYKKNFSDIQQSLLNFGDIIKIDLIKKIFDFQFISGEVDKLLNSFPKRYKDTIKAAINSDGNIDLGLLESMVTDQLNGIYSKYFYIGENVLPIISYIYLKKIEYNYIIKLVESLRYKL